MGQEYSSPKPGAKFQVIGAGLPRTGTSSFARALEILLDGPVYHGGTQVTRGPEHEVKTWIKLLRQWPPKDDAARKANLALLKSRLDGFVGCADAPLMALVPELLELYPDAKVVATTREPAEWTKSMAVVSGAATRWFLRFVLFPLPALRWFPDYIDCLSSQWLALYDNGESGDEHTYAKHVAWLREVVPADRLVFVDVKDGWGPICQALDLPVPRDIPFPRINDSKAIDELSRKLLARGLARWAMILGVVGAVAVAVAIAAQRE